MIIPTLILCVRRYLTILDFFFFFANALFLLAVCGVWFIVLSQQQLEFFRNCCHTNSRGEPAAPAVKNADYVLQRDHYVFLSVFRHFYCVHRDA